MLHVIPTSSGFVDENTEPVYSSIVYYLELQ